MPLEGGPRRTVSVLRHEVWTLRPDREPGAEPVTFAMQCAVCCAASVPSVDFADAQAWTFRHAGRHPSHHSYRELITRPWHAFRPDRSPSGGLRAAWPPPP
ncbi:hypothetical protein QNO07_06465 [Streptomyces sp. 549]|uniref:DUF7848 domain-containing protein n=1 Tax=Streptomyces sp. 549 TaxID=3049076 RepID=UPI0024C389C6|nr:hypothetical protein [Streptomyces sp. 549]MDK1473066.1 hypothetical protein [Streptomyces sp. 549]